MAPTPSLDRPVGVTPAAREVPRRYVRPLAARDIRGLAHVGGDLLVLDTGTGRVALVDPDTDDTRVVNDGATSSFVGARGLALAEGSVWFAAGDGVHRAAWHRGMALTAGELVLPVVASAVAVADGHLYLVVGDELREHVVRQGVLDPTPARSVTLHGVGAKGLSATTRNLWVSDEVEQTVYCVDRATLEQRFTVLTPLERPTAITARDPDPLPSVDVPEGAGGAGQREAEQADEVHVAYYEDEPYLKDNPWIDPCWEVRYRDRALVHRLRLHHDPVARAAWSSGHRLVMHYYVEVCPQSTQSTLIDVTWRMALPLDTARQRVLGMEPIGAPFEIVDEPDGVGASQPVAVFTIPRLDADSRIVLGWRATLEVFGVKHQVGAADLAGAALGPEGLPTLVAQHYLGDEEDLDLDTPQIAQATLAAVAGQDNPYLAARQIRTWVYDRLEYEMGNADTPAAVLERGTGSCGEYVSTLMALLRRAGIACRVAGRYKCPYQPWSGGPLYPDFNHVWVDVHLPGVGWLPMESNPDDVVDGGPYPDRFFLGLPWRHVEVGKDISFEKVTYARPDGGRRRIGARRLSRNHIRFDVLAELAPVAR